MTTSSSLRGISLAASLVLSMCVGCAPEEEQGGPESIESTSQAITNGADDDGDPAVVALMLNEKVHCTGVLVSKTVVVTAAHCLSPSLPDAVFFGSRPGTKRGTTIAVRDAQAHPDYDEDSLANDIAVIALVSRAAATPVPVRVKELDATFKGQPLRIVGFGATGDSEGGLRKREGNTKVDSLGGESFKFHGAPSQTCLGDSGGPAFATSGDQELIVGIASSGDADCKVYATHTRIDRHVDFITGYAKKYAAPSQVLGDVPNSGCSAAPVPSSGSRSAVAALVALALVAGAVRRRKGA